MRQLCNVALLFGLLVAPAEALADYASMGPGTVSCGKFAEGYRHDPTAIENAFFAWAEGFMSGLNVSLPPGTYRDMAAITLEAQKAALRNYCDQHPLTEYGKGVLDLYGKLPMKKAPAQPQ
jgi:hypothetical protein